jgi:formylglycine-generating enzyme required for sulfatase activity
MLWKFILVSSLSIIFAGCAVSATEQSSNQDIIEPAQDKTLTIIAPTYTYLPLPMQWVTVPAGESLMGCHPEHNGGFKCAPKEQPLHSVFLDTYRIGKFEVTNRQYTQCVHAGFCSTPKNSIYNQNEFENHPVTDVSWFDADRFCHWSEKEGRLPTEAEWEKAARGESCQAYPWGDGKPDCTLANAYDDSTERNCVGGTNAVGSYPTGASPYGALDMAGNVFEWVSDWYDDTFYKKSESDNPVGPDEGLYRVVRGGDWDHFWSQVGVASRYRSNPVTRNSSIGFRCASQSRN